MNHCSGVLYRDVPQSLVAEIRRRLKSIDIDAVLDTAYLEEYLSDDRFSILAQVEYTERPDRICGHLLEGRVAILADGSPMAMVVPTSFPQFLNSGEDYYQNFIVSSLMRLGRLTALFMALRCLRYMLWSHLSSWMILSLYLTWWQPVRACLSGGCRSPDAGSDFELREPGSGARAIGPAVSIGAFIIGDAAVQAGLVDPHGCSSFTGIASFVTLIMPV